MMTVQWETQSPIKRVAARSLHTKNPVPHGAGFFLAFYRFYFLPSTNTVNFCIFPVLIARIVHFIYVSLSAIRSITFRKNRVHCYPIATHCHPVTALTPCLLFPAHTGAPCLPSLSAMCGRTCGTPRLL